MEHVLRFANAIVGNMSDVSISCKSSLNKYVFLNGGHEAYVVKKHVKSLISGASGLYSTCEFLSCGYSVHSPNSVKLKGLKQWLNGNV